MIFIDVNPIENEDNNLVNLEFFVSQIFWLTITFVFLFIFLWKISIPKIRNVLDSREKKINNDLEDAKKFQKEAEEIQNQLENRLSLLIPQLIELVGLLTYRLRLSKDLLDHQVFQRMQDLMKIFCH